MKQKPRIPANCNKLILYVLFMSSFCFAEQYRLLPKQMLNEGCSWNYTMTISGQEVGQAEYSGTGTADIRIGRTEEVDGITVRSVEFKRNAKVIGWDKDIMQWRMTPDYLVQQSFTHSDNTRSWEEEIATNNNPLEVLPVFIDSNDLDRPLGSDQYSGVGSDGVVWTSQSSRKISYIGPEVIVVPAGTFDCIHVRVNNEWSNDWDDTQGATGTEIGADVYDYWISSVYGIIKQQAFIIDDGDWQMWTIELRRARVAKLITNEITRCNARAGRDAGSASFDFQGLLDATDWQVLDANDIYVTIDSDYFASPKRWAFPINDNTFKRGRYSYRFSEIGNPTQWSFGFDTRNGRAQFMVKNVDLTGLTCPVSVDIQIGNYLAQFELDEDIVNGTRTHCPPQFMMGVANDLPVDRSQFRHGRNVGSDTLNVSGIFTIEDTYDDVSDLVIVLGTQTFTVPRDQVTLKGTGESCSNVQATEDNGLVRAQFDFSRCTYSISIAKTFITQYGVVDFGVQLFDKDLTGFETIDLGSQYWPSLAKVNVRAGRQRGQDSIDFTAMINPLEAAPGPGEKIQITITSDAMVADVNQVFLIADASERNGVYDWRANSRDVPSRSLRYDTNSGILTFNGKNEDLLGLGCPISVNVVFDGYTASLTADETIVNGTRQPCPPVLLMGVVNSLQVSRTQVRYGRNSGTDSAALSGYFTVAGDYDVADPFSVTLADQTLTIPGGSFTERNNVASCNRETTAEGPTVSGKFDFNRCTYSLSINNAILDTTGEAEFVVDCFGYELEPDPNESNVTIPQSNKQRYDLEQYRCYNQDGRQWTYLVDYSLENSESTEALPGTTAGTVSVATNPLQILGYEDCDLFEISTSTPDGSADYNWGVNYYGSRQLGWGELGDTMDFDVNYDLLAIPKQLTIGQTHKDSTAFEGTFDLGPGLNITDFNGKATTSVKLLGIESITVPHGTYDSAAKFYQTLDLNGTMQIEGFRSVFQASTKQTVWAVEDMGAVKIQSEVTVKLSISALRLNLWVKVTETDQLTNYTP